MHSPVVLLFCTPHQDPSSVLSVSGKTGEGVDRLLSQIVERVPPPTGNRKKDLKVPDPILSPSSFRGCMWVHMVSLAWYKVWGGGGRLSGSVERVVT